MLGALTDVRILLDEIKSTTTDRIERGNAEDCIEATSFWDSKRLDRSYLDAVGSLCRLVSERRWSVENASQLQIVCERLYNHTLTEVG